MRVSKEWLFRGHIELENGILENKSRKMKLDNKGKYKKAEKYMNYCKKKITVAASFFILHSEE